jgi:putative tryptophan/tyrosine transport system substrate-binding protein
MRRREFITLVGGSAVTWPLAARAQQPDRIRRVGLMMNLAESDPDARIRVTAFTKGLEELGWVEGRNLRIDYLWAVDEANRSRTLAAELVAVKPDVILASATDVLSAVRQETQSVPIVFVLVSDPVGQGFVKSLARPGGNITGFTNYEFSVVGKWLELIKEIVPRITQVALMFNPSTAPYGEQYLRVLDVAASSVAVKAVAIRVRSEVDIENAIGAFSREQSSGLIVIPDTFAVARRDLIISLTSRYSVPAIYPFRIYAKSGGLISYGIDNIDMYRRAAAYVDRILKGAKPSELPVQQPTKYELVINQKTAKALGLQIPDKLLFTADEVIE